MKAACSISNCSRPSWVGGRCAAHHQEFRDKINERERKKGREQASARKYYGKNAERLRAQSRDEQRPAVAGRVVELFPPNTRGLTCLFVGPAESHWSPEEFARSETVILEEDRVHALLEPPEDHPLAAARSVLVGGLLGFLLWLIAVSVLLAARPP
jgi:hypothetical protein